AARPDHLDVVGVADERDEVPAVGVAPRLGVHLRDERTHGVDDLQPALLAALLHRRRDAVRGEDADLARRDLVLVLDEDRAELLEPADDVVVVDDLVAHIDRRPVLLEQPLDDLDRSVDARAERSRRRKQDPPAHALGRLSLPRRRAALRERLTPLTARCSPGPYWFVLCPPASHRQRRPENVSKLTRHAPARAARASRSARRGR